MEREYKDSGIEWIGQIPKEWKVTLSKRLFTIVAGATPKTDNVDLWDGDISWITPADYKTEDKFVCSGRRNLSEKGKNSCATYLLPTNSIVFSKRAPIGLVAITAKELCTNQGCLGCIPDGQLIVLFYYYAMSVFTEQFELLGTGTTFKEISATKFANFPFPYPPLPEQQKIAEYLDKVCGEVDEMIALQEQMIEELKAYKQSVITEAVTKGLNPNAPMKDSGIDWIGEIPEHWETSKAKHYVIITNGSDPKTEGDTPVYGSGSSSFKTCGEYKDGPTVLIGRKGATLHIPHFIEGKYWNVDTAFDVKSKDNMKLKYYYYLAVIFDYKYYISQTTLPGMAQSSYNNMIIPCPPFSEQQSVASYLDTKCTEIDSLIAIKQQKIEELKDYKKSVIYEYVTGKKEVVGGHRKT
ncbi:MAG: restriction endonuclease subunit S [Prevotella sp.]|nr:restriction endonuclease subunit S [Prevotella sp.]